MKKSHVALLGIAVGFSIQPMFGQALVVLADHQSTLHTLAHLVLRSVGIRVCQQWVKQRRFAVDIAA